LLSTLVVVVFLTMLFFNENTMGSSEGLYSQRVL